MNWLVQMVVALKHIHSRKILHRDLKTSNLFLTAQGHLKVGDFGIAKVLEGSLEQAQTLIGTPYYMSPEIMENKPYSFKSDVWSLGCIAYELCALQYAFRAPNIIELVKSIISKAPEPLPGGYSRELQDLLSAMLRKDPAARPTIDEVLQTPLLLAAHARFAAHGGPEICPRVPSGRSFASEALDREYLNPVQLLRKKRELEAQRGAPEPKALQEKLGQMKSRKFEHMRNALGKDNEVASSGLYEEVEAADITPISKQQLIQLASFIRTSSNLGDSMQRGLETTVQSIDLDPKAGAWAKPRDGLPAQLGQLNL